MVKVIGVIDGEWKAIVCPRIGSAIHTSSYLKDNPDKALIRVYCNDRCMYENDFVIHEGESIADTHAYLYKTLGLVKKFIESCLTSSRDYGIMDVEREEYK